jgi:hypothetical protein
MQDEQDAARRITMHRLEKVDPTILTHWNFVGVPRQILGIPRHGRARGCAAPMMMRWFIEARAINGLAGVLVF